MNPATGRRLIRLDRGFTAIEITAVATIIAILALILIPLLQERVEKTRLTAAQADLQQIMKAQMLVRADIGEYVRLQDLDNTQDYSEPAAAATLDPITDTPDLAVPHAFWNVEIDNVTRGRIAGQWENENETLWKGPYLPFNRYRTIRELLAEQNGVFFWGTALAPPDNVIAPLGGPIFLTSRDSGDDRYPIDPWGSPYLFFGPGKIYDTASPRAANYSQAPAPIVPPVAFTPSATITEETDFKNCAIYSMGRDGQPGNSRALIPRNLMRWGGFLGKVDPGSDDLEVQF